MLIRTPRSSPEVVAARICRPLASPRRRRGPRRQRGFARARRQGIAAGWRASGVAIRSRDTHVHVLDDVLAFVANAFHAAFVRQPATCTDSKALCIQRRDRLRWLSDCSLPVRNWQRIAGSLNFVAARYSRSLFARPSWTQLSKTSASAATFILIGSTRISRLLRELATRTLCCVSVSPCAGRTRAGAPFVALLARQDAQVWPANATIGSAAATFV